MEMKLRTATSSNIKMFDDGHRMGCCAVTYVWVYVSMYVWMHNDMNAWTYVRMYVYVSMLECDYKEKGLL